MQVDAFWLLSSNRFGVQLLLPLLIQNENVNFILNSSDKYVAYSTLHTSHILKCTQNCILVNIFQTPTNKKYLK